MGGKIGGFLSNDSWFGQLMSRIGIVVEANILFCIFCLPVVTVGASYTALYYVMLKAIKEQGDIHPVKEFWIGFRENFKQATICWLAMLGLFAAGYLDIWWCRQAGGALVGFQYAIYAMGVMLLVLALYLFPVMAAFRNKISVLVQTAFYFAFHKPLYLLLLAVITVFPQMFTFADRDMLPLYGFIWVTCGYALTAAIGAKLLYGQFEPYLTQNKNNGVD